MFPHANEGGTKGVVGRFEEATPFSDLKNDTRTIPLPFITKGEKIRKGRAWKILSHAGHGWT